ncbi:GAF and ANTAR domain-containing protein [Modestobacter marinus]|uniref:GAF and ANTAR domain-containing protein n=1 Tax=Modestobacter marinus TaxID=477641 RepID=UPI001C942DD9|nr:GAF and ANTAR domain-containing protein [Modestobacter marinus]
MQQLLRDLSRIVLPDRSLDDVLLEVLRLATRTIPEAEATSLTLVRDDGAVTAAHHGKVALQVDELQYGLSCGPCLDASRGGVVVRVDDLREDVRFGAVGPRAAGLGVRSCLAVPLPYQGSSIGALNAYSAEPAAFSSPDAVRIGTEVAEALAIAVLNADSHAQLDDQAHNLSVAMHSRAVIEQAKGVLMAQQHVGPDEAFEILRAASQRSNRKVRDVAAAIVASTQAPLG